MHAKRLAFSFFAPVLLLAQTIGQRVQSQPPHAPAAAAVRPVVDDYYSTKIPDPYRYMENLKDPEVQAWMKAQNDYTRALLATIPGRQKLLARIRELDQSAPAQVSNCNVCLKICIL